MKGPSLLRMRFFRPSSRRFPARRRPARHCRLQFRRCCRTSTSSSSFLTPALSRHGQQCGPLFQARTRLARLLEESRRRRRAAAHQVDAARRESPRALAISRAQAAAPRPADGLRLRRRSAVSHPAQRAQRCSLGPGRRFMPRSTGSFAAAVAFPAKRSSKSMRPIAPNGPRYRRASPTRSRHLGCASPANFPPPLPGEFKVGFPTHSGRLPPDRRHGPAGNRSRVLSRRIQTSSPTPRRRTSPPPRNGLTLDLKKDANPRRQSQRIAGLLQLSGGRAYELIALAGPPKAPKPVPADAVRRSANPLTP